MGICPLQRRNRLLSPLAAAFLVALLVASSLASAAEDARGLYKEGLRAFRAGKQAEAIDLFEKSEKANPAYPYPALALARIYQETFDQDLSHYEEAVGQFEKLIEIFLEHPPQDSERALYQAFYFRGLLYLKGGEYDKALEAFRDFMLADPGYANMETVHNATGIAFYYLGEYDKAVEAFRRAISARPDYPEARFNLRSVFTRLAAYNEAQANARAGNLDAALEGVKSLGETAPRFLRGRWLEATVLQKLGRADEAMGVMGEILALDPDHPLTYAVRLELAKLLVARGDRPRALALVQEDLRRFPDTTDREAKAELSRLLASMEATP